MTPKEIQYKALRALRRAGVARRLNLHVPITLNGQRLTLPVLGDIGVDNVVPGERWLYRVLPVLLARWDGAFLDVGANTGQTLLKFLTLGVARPYYAFEPSPVGAAYTQRVAEANGATDVHVVPVGLSHRTAVLPIFSRRDADESASVVEGYRSERYYSRRTFAAVFRGDEAVAALGIDRVAVLKIDVEGAETDVLLGLDETIGQSRPPIVCEILPVYDEATGGGRLRRERIDRALAFLARHRYALFEMDPDGRLTRLGTIETHGDLGRCEHLFLPEEHAGAVETELNATVGPAPEH